MRQQTRGASRQACLVLNELTDIQCLGLIFGQEAVGVKTGRGNASVLRNIVVTITLTVHAHFRLVNQRRVQVPLDEGADGIDMPQIHKVIKRHNQMIRRTGYEMTYGRIHGPTVFVTLGERSVFKALDCLIS